MSSTSIRKKQFGFTMIELLVTVAIIGVLASLAAPSLGGYISRSKMRGVSTDFTLALQRTRMEAVNRNQCASMCMSTNVLTSDPPTCATSGDDWGRGWIVYLNPLCNANAPLPGNLVLVRESSGARYSLENTNSGLRRITFGPRGTPTATMGGFNLVDTEASAPDAALLNRTICLDRLGRVNITDYQGSC